MFGASENNNIFLIFFLITLFFKGLSLHKKFFLEYDVEIERKGWLLRVMRSYLIIVVLCVKLFIITYLYLQRYFIQVVQFNFKEDTLSKQMNKTLYLHMYLERLWRKRNILKSQDTLLCKDPFSLPHWLSIVCSVQRDST